jgi:anti-sigma factor RsiW
VKSKHLGDSIHDLLDGRLRGDRAYTAMAHLGECEECASRFHSLRAARDALNTSEAGIDLRFAQQLLDRSRIAEIAAAERPQNARATRPVRRGPVISLASLALVAVLIVGSAWQVGAPNDVSLEFAQPRKATGASSVAYVDPQGMRNGELLRSWIHPDFSESHLIPIEARVVQRANGQLALFATLLAGTDVVQIVQQHGHLTPSPVEQLPDAEVDTAEVLVVEDGDSSTVVWQAGDVVVALSCECSLPTLESVAAEFPAGTDPGFVERVREGLNSFADALSR